MGIESTAAAVPAVESDREVRALKRGLTVLELVNRREGVSISELAQALRLPRTTTVRVVGTLVAIGYVERSVDKRHYRVTPKVCNLPCGARGANEP